MLSKEDKEEIIVTFNQVLDRRARVPEVDHKDQHAWVEMQMIKEKRKVDFYISVKQDLAKWGIRGTVALILIAAWWAFNQYIGKG